MSEMSPVARSLRLWERDFRLGEWGLAVDDVVPYLAELTADRDAMRAEVAELRTEVETLRLLAFADDELPATTEAGEPEAEVTVAPRRAAEAYSGKTLLRVMPALSIPGVLAFQQQLARIDTVIGVLGMRRADGGTEIDIRLASRIDLASALAGLPGVTVTGGDDTSIDLRVA